MKVTGQKVKSLVLAVLSIAFFAGPAQAADSRTQWFVGGTGGYQKWSDSSVSGRLTYGGEAGLKWMNGFGLGGYFQMSNKDSIKLMVYGGEISYYFGKEPVLFRLGARGGATTYEVATTGVTVTTHPISAGPVASIDYKLGNHLSIGAEANWMYFFKTNSNGISTSAFNVYSGLGTLKVWF